MVSCTDCTFLCMSCFVYVLLCLYALTICICVGVLLVVYDYALMYAIVCCDIGCDLLKFILNIFGVRLWRIGFEVSKTVLD